MSQHGSMTPEEVEVGRRNLIAELRGKLEGALTSTVEVDESTVRDLIAVLEAEPQTAAVLEDAAYRKYAAMDERHLNSCVWIDPGRQSGQPCFGGTRVPVAPFMAIVDEAGEKAAQAFWPSVTAAHIEAGRAFMALLSTSGEVKPQ